LVCRNPRANERQALHLV